MSIDKTYKDYIFQTVISVLLSIIAFFCMQIKLDLADQGRRLRLLEINQARLMERMGIMDKAVSVDKPP
jgi:hypothetical protein